MDKDPASPGAGSDGAADEEHVHAHSGMRGSEASKGPVAGTQQLLVWPRLLGRGAEGDRPLWSAPECREQPAYFLGKLLPTGQEHAHGNMHLMVRWGTSSLEAERT